MNLYKKPEDKPDPLTRLEDWLDERAWIIGLVLGSLAFLAYHALFSTGA